MVAANYNFSIEKGSDFEISFIYNDSSGNPVNLSNKCVEIKLSGDDGRISTYSSRMVLDYDINGASLTADNNGIIVWKLSAEKTNLFNFNNGFYDLDIKNSSPTLKSNVRLSQGIINLINRNIPIDFDCLTDINSIDQIILSPTPTTTTPGEITPTPTTTEITDFCLPYDCGPLDLFSTVYNGSGLVLNDLSTISGSVIVTNTGIINNIELAINKLSHNNPSDLVFLLAPPTGDKILLSANSKIFNFNNNFSFMFSNKASSDIYPHNVPNGGICNIWDKTHLFNYNNENLLSSFSGLFGSSVTGVWNFIVMDTDPGASGTLDSWKLIISYNNDIPEDNMNLSYTIDNDSFAINIYVAGNPMPIIFQPNWPNGVPWNDYNDANLWAQLFILSITNPEAPYAPAGPGLKGEPKN